MDAKEDFAMLGRASEDRCTFYRFLSSLFLDIPDVKFVKKLRSNGFLDSLHSAAPQAEVEPLEGLKTIAAFMEQTKDMPEEKLAEELGVEFTRLFRGIKKGYGPPPPYESVYSDEARVMGTATQEVVKKYAAAGIGIGKEGPPDYIGHELKFMSLLCYKESDAWKKGERDRGLDLLEKEKEFLDEHLNMWVPKFSKKMIKESREDFYRGVAQLTQTFLSLDGEQINHSRNFGKEAAGG